MLPKADLHIHTTCSDGKLTPVQAVELAKARKLSALSITDHDTFKGYFEALPKAGELDIELIPGVEITSLFNGRESHILAYYFDVDSNYFKNFFMAQKQVRKERIKLIITVLNERGIDVTYDEVWAEANGANIGRPHLAKILIQKGYASNIHEAFIRYLSYARLGEIETGYPDYKEVIDIVKSVGGACILAHPGRLYSSSEIGIFIKAGIDGLECIHPSHNWEYQKKYSELATKHSLLMTGGSDYHGGKDLAYSHLGVVTIAAKHCERIRKMTSQRKNIIELKA